MHKVTLSGNQNIWLCNYDERRIKIVFDIISGFWQKRRVLSESGLNGKTNRTHHYSSDRFIATSNSCGGLLHYSDAAALCDVSFQRIKELIKNGRFTLYIFPFGYFLSLSEVSVYASSPRRSGRPSIKSLSFGSGSMLKATNRAMAVTSSRHGIGATMLKKSQNIK